jgi:hypothetical protein
MMERGGLVKAIGAENFFWSSDQAIVEAEKRGCGFCPQDVVASLAGEAALQST